MPIVKLRTDNELEYHASRVVRSVDNYIYWKTLKEDPEGRKWAESHMRKNINDALAVCNGTVDLLMFNVSLVPGCSSIHLMIIENFIMEEKRTNG